MAMLSLQTLLGKILRLPLSLIPPQTEVRVLRGPLRGKKWIVGAATHAFWAGTYEPERLRAFARAVPLGASVYDIGANVGVYSLLASARTGPGGKVYAFEPAQRNLQYLHRHIELNHAHNCMILETAVSNKDGTCRFSAAPWDFSMGHLAQGGELLVPSVTLDTCVYGERAMPPPDVLKIDVEGAELEVLEGATRAITEFHPTIFLEVHGTQLHANCRDFLAAKGYRVEEAYARLTAFRDSPRRDL
jgi:FkbM family methyltransferase